METQEIMYSVFQRGSVWGLLKLITSPLEKGRNQFWAGKLRLAILQEIETKGDSIFVSLVNTMCQFNYAIVFLLMKMAYLD